VTERLHLVIADFTRLVEVVSLADQLAAELPALDVLINNAAIAAPGVRTPRTAMKSPSRSTVSRLTP
jgi:NAD(P)-dependent dehydrogenase (short-subunit alcohol dehydrogenase family)